VSLSRSRAPSPVTPTLTAHDYHAVHVFARRQSATDVNFVDEVMKFVVLGDGDAIPSASSFKNPTGGAPKRRVNTRRSAAETQTVMKVNCFDKVEDVRLKVLPPPPCPCVVVFSRPLPPL
jgi:hypothetical protein